MDIWLNEGFASYSEALWAEHLGGTDEYQAYMDSLYRTYFQGPVYDPVQLFGSTVYDKGAWVLHMLRGVMGDDTFFQSLRGWYEGWKDGVGNTAQYQAHQESHYGAALDWFFQEWVYGISRPQYEYGYSTADLGNGTYRNYVRITQVQTDVGTFTMPVDLTLVTLSGSEVRTVWNDSADQDFVLDTTEPLTGLVFDEANWILKGTTVEISLEDADGDGVPDRNDNCVLVANPTQADFDGDLLGDACDDDDDNDLLEDSVDCAPLDPEQGQPPEVELLTVEGSTLSWTPVVLADAYDLSRGLLSGLQDGYGSCLAALHPDLFYVDADSPPVGDGFAYLVRGHDSGCGGGGLLGSDSAGTPRPSPCP
jgi:hypothetical protein